MIVPLRIHLVLPVALWTAVAGPLGAQEALQQSDEIIVADDEVSGNSGRVAVNLAAGDQNQQVSAATIAMGDVAISGQDVDQLMDTTELADRSTHIEVGPDAFSNNSGLVSLNLTAGQQNQSANLALLNVGTNGVVSDQMLAQASAPTNPAGPSAQSLDPANDVIAIDDTAISGNSGLVQMNLVGGERNSSANTFALNVSAGGNP